MSITCLNCQNVFGEELQANIKQSVWCLFFKNQMSESPQNTACILLATGNDAMNKASVHNAMSQQPFSAVHQKRPKATQLCTVMLTLKQKVHLVLQLFTEIRTIIQSLQIMRICIDLHFPYFQVNLHI